MAVRRIGCHPYVAENRGRVAIIHGPLLYCKVLEIAEAGRSVNPDILVICHGGPFDEPENVGIALSKMPGIAGFFGASSIERIPTERAITAQVRSFKSLALA